MIRPNQFLSSFAAGFRLFGARLSLIINFIILSVVYLIGVGLTSLAAKLAGKRFLSMSISKSQKTYWKDLSQKKPPLERYYRQF